MTYDTPPKILPDGRIVHLITQHTKFDFQDGNGPVPAHRHGNGGGWVANSVAVSASAYIGPSARVYGDAWKTSPIQIQGSRDFVCQSSLSSVAIGCRDYQLTEWLERYEEIGKENNYSEAEIAEYGEYLRLIARIVEMQKTAGAEE